MKFNRRTARDTMLHILEHNDTLPVLFDLATIWNDYYVKRCEAVRWCVANRHVYRDWIMAKRIAQAYKDDRNKHFNSIRNHILSRYDKETWDTFSKHRNYLTKNCTGLSYGELEFWIHWRYSMATVEEILALSCIIKGEQVKPEYKWLECLSQKSSSRVSAERLALELKEKQHGHSSNLHSR